MPANATCITAACHATIAKANHVHGPMTKAACDACHADDTTGKHVFPMKHAGNATCTFCHAISGQRQHQHAVIAEKGCVTCHEPHTSKTKFLLKADSVSFLCAKCHDKPLKKFAHEPFAAGQCTTCHDPHESDSMRLLRAGNGPDQCFTCHAKLKDAMAHTAHTHKPAQEDCLQCHDAHSSDHPRELKASAQETCLGCHREMRPQIADAKVKHSAVTDGKACANCHEPHASANHEMLKDRTDKVCDTCHVRPLITADGRTVAAVSSTTLGKNLHGPLREGRCEPCHQPHGSQNRALLSKAFPSSAYAAFDLKMYSLCFSCHNQEMVLQQATTTLTGFRDGSRNLHFVHVNRDVKGRSCKTCHEIHGSNQPDHLASSVRFEGSQWAMPMNYQAKPEGGSCSPGCHGQLSYNRTTQTTTRPADGGKQ